MAVLKAIVSLYSAGEEKPIERHKTRVKVAEEIEDITCPRVDMNFIFSCSTRYLTRLRICAGLSKARLS